MIAIAMWFIRKARCDAIFRSVSLNWSIIACKAYAHALEFSQTAGDQFGKCLILNNFSNADSSFLFSSTTWNEATKVSGASFLYLILSIRYLLQVVLSSTLKQTWWWR